jgi:hypothetical protein
MPIVYTIGTVVGPALGGALANPLRRPSNDHTNGPFLWNFPYALPNIVIASFFLGGIVIGILFLNETLESKKSQQDWGIEFGEKLVDSFGSFKTWLMAFVRKEPQYSQLPISPGSTHSRKGSDFSSKAEETTAKKLPLSYRSVLTTQTVLLLTSYTLLATHTAGFDQIVSVLLHHPRNGGVASDKTILPFQFNRGFGLGKHLTYFGHNLAMLNIETDTNKIGLFFSIQGIVSIVVQFAIFPLAAQHLGTLKLLRLILAAQPIFYLMIPYTALIQTPILAEIAFITLWTIRSALVIMAVPCSIILVTNSTTSLQVLGTVNGIATATNAIGRAFGPTVSGALFTWGVHNDSIVAPFVFLALLSLLNLPPLFWAVEGDGFCETVAGEQDFVDQEDLEAVVLEQYTALEKE